MPVRGTPVATADLAALAALANANLLHAIVNPAIADSIWPDHPYDRYTGGTFYHGGVLDDPQPDYDFSTSYFVVASAIVANGGHGYVVGDTLTVAGGTLLAGMAAANMGVAAVGPGGAVTQVWLGVVAPITDGSLGGYTAQPLSPNGVTGG